MSRLIQALRILKETNIDKPMSSAQFGLLFWPDHIMHLQVTNTGNGACSGKKGWLCAGSYLAKLRKKGLTNNWTYTANGRYYITSKGKEKLKELEKQI